MTTHGSAHAGIFDRIVCGVDGTAASLAAVVQAARLRPPDGSLVLVAAVSVGKTAHAGIAAPRAAARLEEEAQHAIAEAQELVTAEGKIVIGEPASVLLGEANRATLLALGSHERRRTAGMLLGTVATRMLHEAPCSILIARPAHDPAVWPQTVVAGVDGSAESELAVTVARSIASACASDLRLVTASREQVDAEAAKRTAPELEERDGSAVGVLTAEAEMADLVVVGSRGLQGVKSLGSVSERIAHQATCSVLVVRPAGPAQ